MDSPFLTRQLLPHVRIRIAEEKARILQCEGRVHCLNDNPGVHRVWVPHREAPGLAMSRAFGDYCVKDYGVILVPEVTWRRITAQDQFVILATDGVSYSRKPPISLGS
ncbi:probable protein phosphatase 2C 48 [Triticum aestivum]|uniref:probable protein phosphatase 2C 48 n=1 Tax=Triticum aestivum TaxID=4565 RepID=UPI001D0178E9|nr:probable protein phosphatase 2C 48 [Triticum aestivum]